LTGIAAESIRGVLLDIEGTTTSISFVYDVLFPYARHHVGEFLQKHSGEPRVHEAIVRLHEQRAADAKQGLNPPVLGEKPAETDAVVKYVSWLMDGDSKAGPLKSLQGMIWEDGYNQGEVKGHVFSDVPAAFERWKKSGKMIAIFSSGSVLAQKLLFGRTTAGDLAPFITGYFDTSTGPKREEQSYREIARALGLLPEQILFVSDVKEELDAAAAAGMQTALSVRPGNHAQPPSKHAVIHNFDEVP
jgi:enolase-phosphatase E1